MIVVFVCTCSAAPASATSNHNAYTAGPAKRRRVMLDDDFDDWRDEAAGNDDSKDDVTRYVETIFTDAQTNSFYTAVDGDNVFDIATFWLSAQIRELFPSLARAAIGVLNIPASSASSERVFSVTGRLLEKRRTQLSQNSVDALVYLHSKHHQ